MNEQFVALVCGVVEVNLEAVKKIVFSGDLLRIEDVAANRFKNPQLNNINWIHALFSDFLTSAFPNAEVEILTGDKGKENSIRWSVYDALQLPLETRSWAAIYRDTEVVSPMLANLLGDKYQNSVWVTFEAPPYLIDALNRLGATYIDFSIHPVRFLPDYYFGVRSNNADIQARLSALEFPDDIIYDFARLSKAKTIRSVRREVPAENVLFLGQMGADSSLITDGRMASVDDVTAALRTLTVMHDIVYYKAHPHFKQIDALKEVVQSIPKCQWIDINVYDALGLSAFSSFATLSSGSHNEAKYFGKQSKRFLSNPNLFDRATENSYTPIYSAYIARQFWQYLFGGQEFDHTVYFPNAFDGALKTSLNMKWGR